MLASHSSHHLNPHPPHRSRAPFEQALLPPTLEPPFQPVPERGAVDFEPQRPAAHARRPGMVPQILRRHLVPRSCQLPRSPDPLFQLLADQLDLAAHHRGPRRLDPPGPHLAQPGNQGRNALVLCHNRSLHAFNPIPIAKRLFHEPDTHARVEMTRKPLLACRACWVP